MDFYLLILGIFIACLGYGIYIVYYFMYHRELIKNMNGFDMAKEITSDYDNINVVESQGLYSRYYLNRKVRSILQTMTFMRDLRIISGRAKSI